MTGKTILLTILLSLQFVGIPLFADEMLDYEKLAKLPVSELLQHGDAYLKLNHADTAMGYYIILAGKYSTTMDKSDQYLCALACNSAGEIYFQKENYSDAFKLYLKGLQICERNSFVDLLALFYKNIGNVYGVFQDNQQAISCYKKGLEYARKTGDTKIEMKLLINLSGSNCYAGLTREANIYYDQMMKFAGKDTLIGYFGLLNKALLYANEKKYEASIKSYEQSAAYATRMNLEPMYTGSALGELARLYEKIGPVDSAIHYYRLSIDYSETHNIMYMLRESLKSLAAIYEREGDKKNALLYKVRYLNLSDSLFSMNEFNEMKNTQFVYEMNKNYQKIATLTTDKEQNEAQLKTQRNILYIISGSLLVFIVMLILLRARNRKLNSAYKNLYNRNTELLQSEQKNKNQRIEYAEKLTEEREKYALLEQKYKEAIPENSVVKAEEAGEEKISKIYSTNKLTSGQKEKILSAITDLIENTQELYDCDFSIERLAESIGSNSRYVSTVINETYNKNFRTFINEYRIKEAQLRLMNTAEYSHYTIQAIAESVGYKSSTNFIAAFKSITGITPSIYQKLAKNK